MSAPGFDAYFIRADAELAQEALAGATTPSVLGAHDDDGSVPPGLSGPHTLVDRADLNGTAPTR